MYGDDIVHKSLFYDWYKQFTDAREECADMPCSSRPVLMRNTTTIEKVELVFHNDCRQSLRDITDKTSINWETILLTVTKDLGMMKINAKVVPKNLISDQKLTRVRICKDWPENWDNFDKVITRWELNFCLWSVNQKAEHGVEEAGRKAHRSRYAYQNWKPRIWLSHSLISAG